MSKIWSANPDRMECDSYLLKSGALSSHGRILRHLEGYSRTTRILDVGTATGFLGAALKQRGFQHVSGVEVESEWAEQAKASYEVVVTCDLERDAPPWPKDSFDVIICADILEHLFEPAAVLKKLSQLVVPGGRIIVSLPNVAHWSVRLSLLVGNFQYVSSGILDHGHLRFFTRATARKLFKQVGLEILSEKPTPLPIAHWYSDSWLTSIWQTIERIDWLLACLRPTLFAYQFVFVCRRPNAS